MRYFHTLILLLLTTNAFSAANITARLSHNPVSLDESFHLIYEADSHVDGDPDFSVLTNDFEILSSSQSTNMRSVNGQWSLKKSWDLALISKQAGIFTIPPVPFGSDSSPAVRVTVKPSDTNTMQGTSGKDAYFLEVTTDRKNAWVQSEIIYTVRLFSSIKINRPTLSEPETNDADAIIEQLGQVANYQKLINGMPYTVNELRFAVYPQHSGKLTFKPIVFEGRIPGGRRSSSLFDQFMQSGTLKRMRSKSISVNIKPRPANIPADDWLPAENVSIEEEWSEDITQLRTGEPVTRTLTIEATGLTAEQLDDIEFADIEGVKQYPDKAVIENQGKRDGITGIKQIKVAMIPTQAGRYTVPEIRIPWFNTRTGKRAYASLAETVIEVTGMASATQAPPAIEMQTEQPRLDTQQQSDAAVSSSATDEAVIRPGYWPWISLVLAIGWLTTSILYFRSNQTSPSPSKQEKPPAILPLERAVEKACARSDAADIKDALLEWARVRWPRHNIASLADIAGLCPAELNKQVHLLNATLYSSHHDDWNPKALLSAFHAFIAVKQKKSKPQDSILEPLYKT
ncbi:MAG: protein BatD [Thiotrichales bacterium]|nr:MAG: protein BatD [Thiotrichales bacterium]